MQAGPSHSPQRSFEQASMTTAAGQQGAREVAPARQDHHGRPPGYRRKQWRRSWGSQAAAGARPIRVFVIVTLQDHVAGPHARLRPRIAPAALVWPRVLPMRPTTGLGPSLGLTVCVSRGMKKAVTNIKPRPVPGKGLSLRLRYTADAFGVWVGFCEEMGGFLRSHFMRILRAFDVSLSSIICAFMPPTANARNAEGDRGAPG